MDGGTEALGLTGLKQKIADLLGTGLSETTVAAAVGCTPSYVAQLLADTDFRAAVLDKRVLALQAHTVRDSLYDTLEDDLLNKLQETIPFMTRTAEITRALQVVNSAKRRGVGAQESSSLENAKTVVINMPTQIIYQYSKNANGEVIEVEGRPMVTATSTQVRGLADSATDKKQIGAQP